MIEDIHRMRIRHEEEIAKLQRFCKHEKTSRMPFMWAPGHYGNDVEVCDWCGRLVKTYDSSTILENQVMKIEDKSIQP